MLALYILIKPEEFPVTPVTPEIKPGKSIPEPLIYPEHHPKTVPVEKPDKNSPPEIIPKKESVY